MMRKPAFKKRAPRRKMKLGERIYTMPACSLQGQPQLPGAKDGLEWNLAETETKISRTEQDTRNNVRSSGYACDPQQ